MRDAETRYPLQPRSKFPYRESVTTVYPRATQGNLARLLNRALNSGASHRLHVSSTYASHRLHAGFTLVSRGLHLNRIGSFGILDRRVNAAPPVAYSPLDGSSIGLYRAVSLHPASIQLLVIYHNSYLPWFVDCTYPPLQS